MAAGQVEMATENLAAAPENGRLIEALFVAEQTRLLVRLAADTGARRGELAVLRLADLDGRVLTIERGLSLELPASRGIGAMLGTSGEAARQRYGQPPAAGNVPRNGVAKAAPAKKTPAKAARATAPAQKAPTAKAAPVKAKTSGKAVQAWAAKAPADSS